MKKILLGVLSVSVVSLLFAPAELYAQSWRDRLNQIQDVINPEENDKEESVAPNSLQSATIAENSSAATAMATASCVQAGEEDKAAGIALLFGSGNNEKGLVDNDISQYLVGLCVPDNFGSQFLLNQYLLARGSTYSFYAERSLEELATYLEEAGVELGIKTEALKKDSKLRKNLRSDNGMDKAGFMLNQDQPLSKNADLFVPAIAKLKDEQRAGALEIASRARGHALNSTYFLSRGVYVSQKMSSTMAENAEGELDNMREQTQRLRDQSRTNPTGVVDSVLGRLGGGKKKAAPASPLAAYTKFISDNGTALISTLSNVVNIAKSFDTEAVEIPKLSQNELDQDVERLNDEWELPAEFEDEESYGPENTFRG